MIKLTKEDGLRNKHVPSVLVKMYSKVCRAFPETR